jgi:hypothetical protein
MLTGTVATRLSSIPAVDFDRAGELMELAMEGVLADLERAVELAGRRQTQRGTGSVGTCRDRVARGRRQRCDSVQ